jgi:hypothetical protein
MSKIIIQLQGGFVQDVFIQGTGKPTGYITVDEDYEGADAEDITTVKAESGNDYEAACGGPYEISRLPKDSDVDKMVVAFLKAKGK